MEICTRSQDAAVIGAVNGRMDAVTAPDFDVWISDRVNAAELFLILDLSGLEYVSSAGLRSLLAAAKQIKVSQGDLVLCGLSGTVEEVFRISGFINIFRVFSSVDQALKAIAEPRC
jgi:anti-anti-sigma factor